MTLELSSTVVGKLEELQAMFGATSVIETIRRSVSVAYLVAREVRKGGSVRLESADGRVYLLDPMVSE